MIDESMLSLALECSDEVRRFVAVEAAICEGVQEALEGVSNKRTTYAADYVS